MTAEQVIGILFNNAIKNETKNLIIFIGLGSLFALVGLLSAIKTRKSGANFYETKEGIRSHFIAFLFTFIIGISVITGGILYYFPRRNSMVEARNTNNYTVEYLLLEDKIYSSSHTTNHTYRSYKAVFEGRTIQLKGQDYSYLTTGETYAVLFVPSRDNDIYIGIIGTVN